MGIQPTNNNTEVPPGYDYIDSDTIVALPAVSGDAVRRALAPGAYVQFFACGWKEQLTRDAGKALANFFQRHVIYAQGSVSGWAGTPANAKFEGKLLVGKWIDVAPAP